MESSADADRRRDALSLPLVDADELGPSLPSTPVLALPRQSLSFGRRIAVMGIVNRTPDSFYDSGSTFAFDVALQHAIRLVDEGADIIDVGGIKGGPGVAVSADEEIDRVVPFIHALRDLNDHVLISVDTFRAPVADAALVAGADIVNDVTGLHDPTVLDVVAQHDAGYVAMHHGGQPRTRPFRRYYVPTVVDEVVRHCHELTLRAIAAGVRRDRLIVDPGHDFQKTTAHSLELSRHLPRLLSLGFPVLVALSNKDFIGETLNAPIDQRVDGSLAATVFSVLRGAHIVRVHEVGRTVTVLQMTEALLGWRDPAIAVRGLE